MRSVQDILDLITYKQGWYLRVHDGDGRRQYMQLHCDVGIDSRTGEHAPWVSGKRYLSAFMTTQEVVGVAFDLIKTAEMHECAEWFRYKGASIYNQHLSPDVLAEVASKASSFEVRPDSMTKA